MPNAIEKIEPDNSDFCNNTGCSVSCFQRIPWNYRYDIWRRKLLRRKIMKKFSVALIILTLAVTWLIVPTFVYAVTNKVVLQIEGMTWPAWPVIIKKALEGLDGVEKANISYSKKKGEVFFDPDKVNEKEIVNKVNEVGFKATVIAK